MPRWRTETTSTSSRREQTRHRPGQGRVAEHDDPLDPVAELAGQEQAVGADDVVPGAAAARRLGEQRPAGRLGELAGRRTGVVAGDHHGAGAEVEHPCRGQRAAPPAPPTSGTSPPSHVSSRQERVVELDVEVHGASAVVPAEEGEQLVQVGAETSSVGAKGPKRPTWSVVWLAPVPRSRAGRSAVTTTSGTPAWAASTTAGSRLATAVPEVQTTAAGRPPTFARPRARKAAVRSSIRVCSRTPPSARVGVVEGEGERRVARARGEHDLPDGRTAQRRHHGPGELGRGVGHAGRILPYGGEPAPPVVDPLARRPRAGPGLPGRPRAATPASMPSTGSIGSVTTSSVSSWTVARPQAWWSSGSAAASATPAAIPTLDSTALETTTGRPMSSAIRRQARTPPSGWTFSTAMSAASRSRTR